MSESEAPHAPQALQTNIRELPTTFHGREVDLDVLRDFFARGDRIVTLVGPAGAGKTRLASRFAAVHGAEFLRSGGVWFCDITESRNTAEVVSAVASTLGAALVGSHDDASALEQLGQAVASRGSVLLVVDNCEQAVAAAAETIWRLHDLAPAARFLVTSRERLNLPAERVHEVGPLTLPGSDPNAARSEAVQLFLDRTKLVRPDYVLTDAERPSVIELVRRLDGLPLAIELAAARMRLFDAQTMLGRLDQRMQTLAHPSRTAVGHHRTLHAALEWSWALLEDWERAALRQCAVFAGGFTIEAVEAVVDLSPYPGAPTILDVFQSLRDKSLVRAQSVGRGPGEVRLGLYESIRDFALEKLAEAEDQHRVEARHAHYFLEHGAKWAQRADLGARDAARRLADELDNLRAVYARARPGSDEALRAILVIDTAILPRGPYAEHQRLLDEGLTLARAAGEDRIVADFLMRRARLHRRCGRLHEARSDAVAAVALAKRAGALLVEAGALRLRGQTTRDLGDRAAGLADYRAAMDAFRAAACPQGEARSLLNLAGAHTREGELEIARDYLTRSIELAEGSGDEQTPMLARTNLGTLLQELGRFDEAEVVLRRAAADARGVGDAYVEGQATVTLGSVHHERGESDAAERCYRDALALFGRLGSRPLASSVLTVLGGLLAARAEIDEARAMLDRAESALAHFAEWLPVVAVYRGHVELALARRCEARDDAAGATEHRAAAARRLAEGATQAKSHEDLRTALRLLRRALDDSRANSDASVLVGPAAEWFRLREGEKVDLRRQPRLQRLMHALVQAHVNAPGKALTIEELIRQAWPGERMLPRAAKSRVQVAISTLRRLGLRDLLVSEPAGYLLDPKARVRLQGAAES